MSRIILIILCVIAAVALYLIYAFGKPNSEEGLTNFWGGLVALAILVALIIN